MTQILCSVCFRPLHAAANDRHVRARSSRDQRVREENAFESRVVFCALNYLFDPILSNSDGVFHSATLIIVSASIEQTRVAS